MVLMHIDNTLPGCLFII